MTKKMFHAKPLKTAPRMIQDTIDALGNEAVCKVNVQGVEDIAMLLRMILVLPDHVTLVGCVWLGQQSQ